MSGLLEAAVITQFTKLSRSRQPSHICLAPGRINLIGEHIDYNGYGVVPCAVGRFNVVAIGASSTVEYALSISLISDNTSQFNYNFTVVESIPKNNNHHHWTNYVLAAYLGLRDAGIVVPRGIQMVVGGNLPQACGLSSSSSLVVASAMALAALRLDGLPDLSLSTLANICMKAEWYVGTAGGGMDQAAILLSQDGFATNIEFYPTLNSHAVRLPAGTSFIVADSCTRSAKAETAPYHFNKRVFECRIATRILRQSISSPTDKPMMPDPLEDDFHKIQRDTITSFSQMIEQCRDIIPSGSIGREAIANLVGQTVIDRILDGPIGRAVWDCNDSFQLLDRALHVYGEAERVKAFVSTCDLLASSASGETGAENGSSDVDNDMATNLLADLMNQSHESTRLLYDCSCQDLDRLCSIMREVGCRAARLTGAGWGGCAVGLAPTESVPLILERIKSRYFVDVLGLNNPAATATIIEMDSLCFAFEPAAGATIRRL
eukprot:gene22306-30550_t